MMEPVISLRGISKYFGPVVANQDVDFSFHSGRVHALLGENGAGKSTLMSILAGRYTADKGSIVVQGKKVVFSSPASALEHGIGMVYQRFMLIESMTVAENISLAAFKNNRQRDTHQIILKTAKRYGLSVDPDKYVYELSMGERQRVEIIKLLLLDAQVLIFDEPTAVLTPPEIDSFFEVLDTLRNDKKAIVFITHKLEEVLKLADDISIMRKGRLLLTTKVEKEKISKQQLARLMVGRDVVLRVDKEALPLGEAVLSLNEYCGQSYHGGTPFRDITFDVHQGEIFSIIGVAGNGQSALVAALTGLFKAESGEVCYLGKNSTAQDWWRSSKEQMAYVPEDRHYTGSVSSMSIADNFALTRLSSYATGPGGLQLDKEKMIADGERAIEGFRVKAQSSADTAGSLSGGNLQKMILARELAKKPKLFIAEQPTQGLDIAATEDIWQALLASRKEAGVLLVTGDLKEVLSLSDRIAVMFNGRILEIIDAKDVDAVGRVGLLMAGVK